MTTRILTRHRNLTALVLALVVAAGIAAAAVASTNHTRITPTPGT